MRALLLLLLAAPAWSQDKGPVFPLPLFTEGLYTRYSANAIPDGALSDALNITLDEDVNGVVVARKGYSKYNSTALTNSKSVRGLWNFDATDGTKYFVAFSSQSFYKSIGDGTFTQIAGLTGFSTTKEFDCTQTIGKLWCGNGDVVFSWDGTSTATISAAPLGNLMGRFRNRVLISGISGAKGRVRGSGELDGTDYTVQIPGVSTTPFNIAFGGADDGEDITCLMGAYQDVFVVGKRNSLWAVYGFGRNDFQVRELSREVGCIDYRSVREKGNCLYWLSLRGVEKYCGASISRISDPIRDQIDTIVATAGNLRTAVDTSQSDFEAGNLTASGPGAPISATISGGNIIVSSTTNVDTSSAEFAGGTLVNVSTADINGSLVLPAPYAFQDTFTDNDYTANPVWSVLAYAAGISVAGGILTLDADPGGLNFPGLSTPQTMSEGRYTIVANVPISGGSIGFYMQSNALLNGYAIVGSGGEIQLARLDSAVITPLKSFGAVAGISKTYEIVRSSVGVFSLALNGVSVGSVTDNTYSVPSHIVLTEVAGTGLSIDSFDFKPSLYSTGYSTGSFTSRIFDTAFSTPTWGIFNATFTATDGNVAFYLQSSTASDGGGMTTILSSSDTLRPSSLAQKRYWRYRADFSTNVSTKTVQLDAVSLISETTGYFISQCRNPSTAITAWGLFSCTQELNSGDLTYYVSTGVSCNAATRSTATWNTQPNNSVISIATAPFVAYRVLFDVDSGTETPRVRDCTINWTEGATRPPVASSIYRDRYYLAYTSSTASGTVNDHILVLDKNDKWTLFDNHNCYSLNNYERKLYCGSSTDAGQIWLLDNGTDDVGTAITSRIRTKAFNLGLPDRRKVFDRIYLDLEPSPEPTQTITLTGRYTLERSSPTYSLGTVDLNEDLGSIMTSKFPFPLSNPVSGKYIQIELESSGLNSPWRLFGGRLYYSPLDLE